MRKWEVTSITPHAISLQMFIVTIIAAMHMKGNRTLCIFVSVMSLIFLFTIIASWFVLWRREDFKPRLANKLRLCRWYWPIRLLHLMVVVTAVIIYFKPIVYTDDSYIDDYNYAAEIFTENPLQGIIIDARVLWPRSAVEALAAVGQSMRIANDIAEQVASMKDMSESDDAMLQQMKSIISDAEPKVSALKETTDTLSLLVTILFSLHFADEILRVLIKHLIVKRVRKLNITSL